MPPTSELTTLYSSATMVISTVTITTSMIEKIVTADSTVLSENTFARSSPLASRPVVETSWVIWSNTPTTFSSAHSRPAATIWMRPAAIDSMNVTLATDQASTRVSDRLMRRALGAGRRTGREGIVPPECSRSCSSLING